MIIKVSGKYFGTEINGKWWRRYKKRKMLARGSGVFSCDERAISFIRKLTTKPIVIELKDVVGYKTGKWHAGQWGAGETIIKVLWQEGDQLLSSGFSLAAPSDDMEKVLSNLTRLLEPISK